MGMFVHILCICCIGGSIGGDFVVDEVKSMAAMELNCGGRRARAGLSSALLAEGGE